MVPVFYQILLKSYCQDSVRFLSFADVLLVATY